MSERTQNAIRVARHKKLKGNDKNKRKYHILREKYGIKSVKANEMKYWGREKILDYLQCNRIYPIKPRENLIDHD